MQISRNHHRGGSCPTRRTGVTSTLIALALACGPSASSASAQATECENCRPRQSIAAAAAEIAALNLITWSYDRFVAQADWTHVGPSTWKENLSRGFTWDGNRLSSNQIMHPLHGGLYFNVSRASGFDYWSSMAGAAFGSLLWEFMGETHPAAGNDLVGTTIGGAALGETMLRLSAALAPPSGRSGLGRRLAAGLVNPAGMVAGALGARNPEAASLPGRITVSVAAGVDHAPGSTADPNTRFRPVLDLGVRFGDPTADAVSRPFDVFEFSIRLGRGISSGRSYGPDNPVDRLESRGALTTAITRSDRLTVGIYQHIDFFRSPTSEFGAQSVTAAVLGAGPVAGSLSWSGEAHLGAMLLGSSPSRLAVEPKRTNDYGPGALAKIDARITTGRTDLLRIEARGYWLRDVSGTRAHHLVMLVSGEIRLPIASGFGVGSAVEVTGHAVLDDQLHDPDTLTATSRFTVFWSPRR